MEKELTKGQIVKEWLKDIIIAVVIALIIMQFVKPTIVKESSMEPNFEENDYLFVNKQAYGIFGSNPKKGDVVVFHSNLTTGDGNEKLLIKRVIGVPGDTITINDGKVYVNNKKIDDSYTKERFTNGDIEDLIVPEDEYFVMGDNRRVSIDSRSPDVGFVAKKQIIGKVFFRLMPFSKMGFIHNPYKK